MAFDVNNTRVIKALTIYEVKRSMALGTGLTDSINELVYYDELVNANTQLKNTLVSLIKVASVSKILQIQSAIDVLRQDLDSLDLYTKRARLLDILQLQAELEALIIDGS